MTDENGNETRSEERVDITSVNGGKNYIYDDAAVKEIGWIWKSEVWDDVTIPGNLLKKGQSRLGKVGNAFTAELSNEELAFKENGQKIAYISNNSLVITNAEIRNKLSLGNETRGWFDFIPRANGNLSIKWRDPVS